jgi:hypothetical protein
MTSASIDPRSHERRALDERIAAEPPMGPPELPADAVPLPMEVHLSRQLRRPVAVEGIVENGVVRPLDPAVTLKEHSRVIIVASASA